MQTTENDNQGTLTQRLSRNLLAKLRIPVYVSGHTERATTVLEVMA